MMASVAPVASWSSVRTLLVCHTNAGGTLDVGGSGSAVRRAGGLSRDRSETNVVVLGKCRLAANPSFDDQVSWVMPRGPYLARDGDWEFRPTASRGVPRKLHRRPVSICCWLSAADPRSAYPEARRALSPLVRLDYSYPRDSKQQRPWTPAYLPYRAGSAAIRVRRRGTGRHLLLFAGSITWSEGRRPRKLREILEQVLGCLVARREGLEATLVRISRCVHGAPSGWRKGSVGDAARTILGKPGWDMFTVARRALSHTRPPQGEDSGGAVRGAGFWTSERQRFTAPRFFALPWLGFPGCCIPLSAGRVTNVRLGEALNPFARELELVRAAKAACGCVAVRSLLAGGLRPRTRPENSTCSRVRPYCSRFVNADVGWLGFVSRTRYVDWRSTTFAVPPPALFEDAQGRSAPANSRPKGDP
jgi:hypothetical protein